MLVLTRMSGQRVVITIPAGWSGSFMMEVGRVTKNGPKSQIRLAFDAPKEVEIMREELTYRPKENKS